LKKYRAISLALALGLTLTTAPALAKTPKPTLAEIEAAKKVEAAKKKPLMRRLQSWLQPIKL